MSAAARRTTRRSFKDRLERVCALHGTTSEAAKVSLKSSRKVTYVIEWGRVDNVNCFQSECGRAIIIPNGFKVTFEASNYAWIAEVHFAPPSEMSYMPMYQVFPVNADGTPQQPGSGLKDNISSAFRKALSLLNNDPDSRNASRHNGRLYLGIFYPTAQDELRKILQQDPSRISMELRADVDRWLRGSGRPGPPSMMTAAAAAAAASPHHSPVLAGGGADPATAAAAAATSAAAFGSQNGPTAGFGHGMPVSHDQARFQAGRHPPGVTPLGARGEREGSSSSSSSNSSGNGSSNHSSPYHSASAPVPPSTAQLGGHHHAHGARDGGVGGLAPNLALSGGHGHGHSHLPHRSSPYADSSSPMGHRSVSGHSHRSNSSSLSSHSRVHAARSGSEHLSSPIYEDWPTDSGPTDSGPTANQTFRSGPPASRQGGIVGVPVKLEPDMDDSVLELLQGEDILGSATSGRPHANAAAAAAAVGHGVGLARKALADPPGSSTPPLPEVSWTPLYQSTPPNSASDARTAAGRIPASRKRTLAEGGQALLRYAAMSGDTVLDREAEDGAPGRAKLGDIEQQLAALLDQIKKSSIEEGEEPTRDSKPSSRAGEETMKRMLKTLESIKRELVSRNGKRRRTLTDHSDDAGSECSQSSVHFGRGRLVRGNSGINLLNMDQESVSQSMNAISSNNAPHKNFGAISALDFDLNGGLFCDIEDFDMAPGNGRQQIIVGCHLTHEGLYFTLAPSDSGFNEEELANAMTSLRIPAASSIARATIEAADRDKNGCVSMEEFLSFLKKREEELEDMFKRIDTDNDGIISIQDLKIARESGMLEQNATDDELQALLEWMDTLENAYEDGQIHFEEFRTGMILLPPSTTINDLLRHFREKGTPRARYSRNSSVNMSSSDLQF